jgi:hypothetical protein
LTTLMPLIAVLLKITYTLESAIFVNRTKIPENGSVKRIPQLPGYARLYNTDRRIIYKTNC